MKKITRKDNKRKCEILNTKLQEIDNFDSQEDDIRSAKSNGFAMGPTVLKQISWFYGLLRKSHAKFKHRNKLLSTSSYGILSKKEIIVFRLNNCCVFYFILYRMRQYY